MVVIEVFTPVVQRILKHNMVRCIKPFHASEVSRLVSGFPPVRTADGTRAPSLTGLAVCLCAGLWEMPAAASLHSGVHPGSQRAQRWDGSGQEVCPQVGNPVAGTSKEAPSPDWLL